MCDGCNAVMVQGILVHERGCPEAWRTEARECRWCGSDFTPEHREQKFCCEGCMNNYNGDLDDDDIDYEETV